MTTKTKQETHESRWGFHSCSYETYQKLRKLNYWSFLTKKAQARHDRWYRKEPQNRVIRKTLCNELGQKIGSEVVGTAPEPKVPDLFRDSLSIQKVIEKDYRAAKFPVGKEEDVTPLSLEISAINDLYEKGLKMFDK